MSDTTTYEVLDTQIAERISVARIALLMRFPFWGNLVSRLRSYQVNTSWCPTACTDGRATYYNPEFIRPLTDKQVIFVFCHEITHVVLEHLGRSNDLAHDNFLGNLAADFSVNQIVLNEGIGEHIGDKIGFKDLMNYKSDDKETKKQGTLYDKMFDGWTYEEIYEHLQKNEKQLRENLQNNSNFTVHLEFGDKYEDDETSSGRPTLSKEELDKIKTEMKEALLNASQSAGNIPGGFKRLISNLTDPKMNWQELLTQVIESQVKSDYTYMRLGRRSFSSDIIFPSQQKQPKIKVYLALDMSGSIGPEEINDFFTEVSGIVQQFSAFEIHIMCFDCSVHNYQVFNEDTVNDLFDYEPQGGGGTSISCVYDFLKENEIVPEQLVFFTDGEVFGDWGDENYTDALFIIKNHREIEASHGTTVMYS